MLTAERLDEITKQYYDTIYTFCLSRSGNNPDDALDITQEVFTLMTEKRNELDDKNLKQWLLEVAKYKTKENYRQLKKHEKVSSFEETFTSADEIFSTMTKFYSYSDADIQMTLDAILKLLKKKEYELYIKKYVENKTHEEIAEEFGISVSSVSSRLDRLKKKIRRLGFFAFTFVGQFIIKNFF